MESMAGVSETTPLPARGQTNLPRSSLLATRTRPWPSQTRNFKRSPHRVPFGISNRGGSDRVSVAPAARTAAARRAAAHEGRPGHLLAGGTAGAEPGGAGAG